MASHREDVGFKTKLMMDRWGTGRRQGQPWGGHTEIERTGREPLSGLLNPTVTASLLPGNRVESDHFVAKTGRSQRQRLGGHSDPLRPQTFLSRQEEVTNLAPRGG